MAAHAYWRLYVTAVKSGTTLNVAELVLRTSPGGAQAATGGTASASSTNGVNAASRAFDGVNANYWATPSASLPAWIRYDFAAPVDIVEFAVTCSTNGNTQPVNMDLQWSDDGTAWTSASLHHLPAATWLNNGTNQSHTFTAGTGTGAHEAWRILINNSASGTGVTLDEIEFRASSGGAQQASGGTAAGSHATSSAVNAFSGTNATWPTGVVAGPWWISYLFRSPVSVAEVMMKAPGIGGTSMPIDFALEYSDDFGSTWTALQGFLTPATWTGSEIRTFAVSSGAGAADSGDLSPRSFPATSRSRTFPTQSSRVFPVG